jgi:outer membrane murein-binding lipoprotein Lpp
MKTTLFALSFLTISTAASQGLEKFDANENANNLGKVDRMERIEKQVEALTKEVMPLKKMASGGSGSSSGSPQGIVSSAELEKVSRQVSDLVIKVEELRNSELRPMRTTLDRLNSLSGVIESDVARIRSVDIEALKTDIATLAAKLKQVEERLEDALGEDKEPPTTPLQKLLDSN